MDEIFRLFRDRGHRTYGENVTEVQHALQCATFAEADGDPPEVVAACLLHDLGHLLHDLGEDIASRGVDARHERIGANRLEAWFPARVVEPIRLHAEAKRYLCTRDPGYLEALSEASRRSLMLQGGPMSAGEAERFEAGEHFSHAVRLRRHDDRGKIPGMPTPDIEHFRPVLESLIRPDPPAG